MNHQTIDTTTARHMAETGTIRGAAIVGQAGGWCVMLKMGMTEKPLGGVRSDKPRMWRSVDTLLKYLRKDLHIVKIDSIDATHHNDADVMRVGRPDQAARMKRAHEAAAYDEWLRAEVQASMDDPRPSLTDEEASEHMERVFAELENAERR